MKYYNTGKTKALIIKIIKIIRIVKKNCEKQNELFRDKENLISIRIFYTTGVRCMMKVLEN